MGELDLKELKIPLKTQDFDNKNKDIQNIIKRNSVINVVKDLIIKSKQQSIPGPDQKDKKKVRKLTVRRESSGVNYFLG